MRIKVVGAGLIGTSLALALKASGHQILCFDKDPNAQSLARELVGTRELDGSPELIIVATPIPSILPTLLAEFESNPEAMFMDIGGLKSNLLHNIEEFPDISHRFISLHPMAGREISGAKSARADLFDGRAVLITPTSESADEVLTLAKQLVKEIGAQGYLLAPNEHDRVIALVSHLPQAVASVLGATLANRDPSELAFAGGGLRDTSRLASSDSKLWRELLMENSAQFISVARDYLANFNALIERVEASDGEGIEAILSQGRAGREAIPGKHGGKSREYTYLPIVIDDKPGQLAKIFEECARANVNVEDLTIEHSPGQEKGLVTLALSSSDAVNLHKHLLETSWRVQAPYTH